MSPRTSRGVSMYCCYFSSCWHGATTTMRNKNIQSTSESGRRRTQNCWNFCRLNGSREYHRISAAQKLFIIRRAATTRKIPDRMCVCVSSDVEQQKKKSMRDFFKLFLSFFFVSIVHRRAIWLFCQQRYGWHSVSFCYQLQTHFLIWNSWRMSRMDQWTIVQLLCTVEKNRE